MKDFTFDTLILLSILFFSFNIEAQPPLFPNSVVSNDIDFILETDPDSFTNLTFVGLENKEMPGAPNGGSLFDVNTFVFEAAFSDGETLEIWCHSSFNTQAAAQEYADKLCPRLGKLPAFQRNMLDHVVIHKGNGGAFAEIEGQFFILYSDNMDARISTNDLEETVFHESVHASYQFMYENSPEWTSAQAADPTFITVYAQDNPQLEDLAESALFAYTYLTHPGRLSPDIETWLEDNIPNRLAFFGAFYTPVTSVTEADNQFKLSIHPNPTNGIFTLQASNKLNGLVSIFDTSGNLVKSKKCYNQEQIEINLIDLPIGLYIISFPGYRNAKVLKY
jgi:hypothetical protein